MIILPQEEAARKARAESNGAGDLHTFESVIFNGPLPSSVGAQSSRHQGTPDAAAIPAFAQSQVLQQISDKIFIQAAVIGRLASQSTQSAYKSPLLTCFEFLFVDLTKPSTSMVRCFSLISSLLSWKLRHEL
jgi:hypothetical protein